MESDRHGRRRRLQEKVRPLFRNTVWRAGRFREIGKKAVKVFIEKDEKRVRLNSATYSFVSILVFGS